jgi:DNA repair exonuclease SbcCD ATPase subunit
MPNPLSDVKRRTLERRLAALAEEYEAASAQLDRALSDVERLRIQREIEHLDAQMQEVASQLDQLAAPTEQPPPRPIDPATVSPAGLRTAMRTVYNIAELQILCSDLAVDYENLGGQRLENKILELISHMRRRGRYAELVRKVLADRPIIADEL